MKNNFKIIAPFIIAFFWMASCGDPATNNQQGGNNLTEPPTEQPTKTPDEASQVEKLQPPPRQDCKINGKVLEGNRKLISDQNMMVVILADSTTFDKTFGDSHRILEVFDMKNCDLMKRVVLPINISPDFSYQIADIIYNKTSHVVAIKAHGGIYCYDIENQKLSVPMVPDFINERMQVDAQSGRVDHLEVWENYLVGYARDWGSFVYDLSDAATPKQVMPAAEYDLTGGDEEEFSSLFFLKSNLPTGQAGNGNTYQAIIPSFDYEEKKFVVNALLKNPKNINPTIPKNVSNNRFIILRTNEEPPVPVAIDMEKQMRVELPEEIASKKTSEILAWVKKNQQ